MNLDCTSLHDWLMQANSEPPPDHITEIDPFHIPGNFRVLASCFESDSRCWNVTNRHQVDGRLMLLHGIAFRYAAAEDEATVEFGCRSVSGNLRFIDPEGGGSRSSYKKKYNTYEVAGKAEGQVCGVFAVQVSCRPVTAVSSEVIEGEILIRELGGPPARTQSYRILLVLVPAASQ